MTVEIPPLNFGGFIPVSTLDWHGRSACVVFFRGCNLKCPYCHNAGILTGIDSYPIPKVLKMIRGARITSSSLVLSGGEPTLQPKAVVNLARGAAKMGMETCLFTNGTRPFILDEILKTGYIQKVSLDIKPIGDITDLGTQEIAQNQRESYRLCRNWYGTGLPEFEITFTLFRGQDLKHIPREIPTNIPLIIQQGITPSLVPFTEQELREIAKRFHHPQITIRTRENGDVPYG